MRGDDAAIAPDTLDDAFFRSLFESDIAGLAVADLGTQTVIAANERLLEILGRSRADIVGVPNVWLTLTPPEYRHLDLAAMEAVLAGGRADPFEKEYLRPDGSRVAVRVSTTVVAGQTGKIIVAISDISAERRKEREARHHDEQLGALADSLPALIAYIDDRLVYRFVNRHVAEWFGLPRARIVGRPVEEFFPATIFAARRTKFDAVLAGEAQRFEADTPHADGTLRIAEMQYVPRFDTGGAVVGFYVLATDISARKTIEDNLRRTADAARESEARFRAMAEAAPVMIWQSGPTGETEYLNPAYLSFFGKSAQEVMGFGWVPAEHPDDKEASVRAYLDATRDHVPFEMESRLLDAEGRYRRLHSVGVPRFDSAGTYLGHIGTSRDVTEEREAEAQQRLLIDELNHRVKNTLAVVQSLAWQTLRNSAVPEGVRTAFEQRLMALATAHDVLTSKNWQAASIEVIICRGLEALSIDPERVSIAGPLLRMPPKTAVSLAMAVHELATNALKYGSLSAPQGRVDVAWRADEAGFELTWTERGGPPVAPPTTQGFGTRLLERGLAAELGGNVALAYEPAGVVCTIAAPIPSGGYVIA